MYLSILSSGCSIQSSQLNGLLNLISQPFENELENAWLVKYKNRETLVTAVTVPNGTLFANFKGDQFFFDGWTVRRISWSDQRLSSLNIMDLEHTRKFERNDYTIATHYCDKWKRNVETRLSRFMQTCRGPKTYNNEIIVNSNGHISFIRQIMDERYTPITIIKLN